MDEWMHCLRIDDDDGCAVVTCSTDMKAPEKSS